MRPRITNPVLSVPGVLDALRSASQAAHEAARHYDERALVVCIAAINTWNRLNVITGQVAGEWTTQWA